MRIATRLFDVVLNFHKIVVFSYFAQVIDCEKERDPGNGVEKLKAGRCSNDGGEVRCVDSCPPQNYDYGQKNCSCGIMVYKNGRQISGDELHDYPVDCKSASGIPLTAITALVRFLQTSFFYNRRLSFRLEQQPFFPNLDPLLEIQILAPQDNAGESNNCIHTFLK